MYTALNCYPHK